MVAEPSATVALDRLESGDLDLYIASVSDPQLLERVRESAELRYNTFYGVYTELTFNTVLSFISATQQTNFFSNSALREAMNYLVDRDYIAREIYGGMAVPRFTCLDVASPDSARMAGVIHAIELKYAYNPARAKEMIDATMQTAGASLEGGKWMYQGRPVTLTFLIRIEDERRAIGDYVADQLESIGFTVDRQYKSRAEAMSILEGDAELGQWNIYTGAWESNSIGRDLGSFFDFFYTMPWQREAVFSYKPAWRMFTDRYGELWENDIGSLGERPQLFQEALELSLVDSTRVFLNDQVAFTPYRSDIAVAAEMSSPGGWDASLWALTLRRQGQEGGLLTVAQPSLLAGPWNGIAGSDQVYDWVPQQATAGAAVLSDPYVGLYRPQRIEKAEVVATAELPITKTLDWVTLKILKPTITIKVPKNAWVDWDPVNQKFITAGEKYQDPVALAKITIYYPAGMYQAVKWHDGSPLSAADFVLNMILAFDRARSESAIYDQSAEADEKFFLANLKGIRVVSVDPLIIETYTDIARWYMDAELAVAEATWWPQYGHGEQPWHTLAVVILAESDKKLAFSQAKAEELGVEWASFVSGPSLDILKEYLDRASAEGFVPYAPTLAQYLGPDEVATRYANLAEWVRTKGHFWVGTGPYYLDSISPAERTLVLNRFPDYSDPADKWLRFSEPRPATAAVSGPEKIVMDHQAAFQVDVTFQGQPYPVADIEQVKYMIFDLQGRVVGSGRARVTDDGHWLVSLGPTTTGSLVAGVYQLEVDVVSKVVGIPAFASCQFDVVEE